MLDKQGAEEDKLRLCCSATQTNSTESSLSSVIIDDGATVVLPLASVADKQEGLEATVGHALGQRSSTLEEKTFTGMPHLAVLIDLHQ